ncbi:hypothetical protein B9Z55_017072 [Caenorhabditis nigoni]|uniref:DUF38 domain-containing protein n=1 Tax=Caenorhabditis nigoni TaxID=1611254 RepID=A0A2G5T7X6_9PELO|nr:hypothetical protein B9Z55_017072 [Caenorhabditis nigoni]
MESILRKYNFQEDRPLQKALSYARSFFTDSEFHLKVIALSVHDQYILFAYKTSSEKEYNFMYRQRGKSCEVSCGEKEVTMENSDFVEVFLKDFEILLSHQNSILDTFWLATRENATNHYTRILEATKTILDSRGEKLTVTNLLLELLYQNQIHLILPSLDFNVLKSVNLNDPTSHGNSRQIEIMEDSKFNLLEILEEVAKSLFN